MNLTDKIEAVITAQWVNTKKPVNFSDIQRECGVVKSKISATIALLLQTNRIARVERAHYVPYLGSIVRTEEQHERLKEVKLHLDEAIEILDKMRLHIASITDCRDMIGAALEVKVKEDAA